MTGTEEPLAEAWDAAPCSGTVNTSFIERHNGSARHFNARKQRKPYPFSKQTEEHEAMSWLMVTHYNFCWKPRTLRIPIGDRRYRHRTPAMAAGLTGHSWSVMELLSYQLLETG